MYAEEKFDDYIKANPNASYCELQSKMSEILAEDGGSSEELEEMLNDHFEDYQSDSEDFEDEDD